MANDAINWAWKVRGLTAAERLLLVNLCDTKNRDDDYAWPAQERMVFEMENSLRYTQRILKRLEKKQFITTELRTKPTAKGKAAQTSNAYFVHTDRWFPPSEKGELILNELKKVLHKRMNVESFDLWITGLNDVFFDEKKGVLWIAIASKEHFKWLATHRAVLDDYLLEKFGPAIRRYSNQHVTKAAKQTSAVRIEILRTYQR